MNQSIRRNKGVFEAESRLWAAYIAVPLYICGFVTLGAARQERLTTGALIMGWGITEFSVMTGTVAVCMSTSLHAYKLGTERTCRRVHERLLPT